MQMKKMKSWLLRFWINEEGLGTLEILLIIAVLIGVALLFRETITTWVSTLLENMKNSVPLDVPK